MATDLQLIYAAFVYTISGVLKFKDKGNLSSLYRLIAKGKSKKLALMAVANKLVKQAFAIARSLVFDENYRSVNPINLKKIIGFFLGFYHGSLLCFSYCSFK